MFFPLLFLRIQLNFFNFPNKMEGSYLISYSIWVELTKVYTLNCLFCGKMSSVHFLCFSDISWQSKALGWRLLLAQFEKYPNISMWAYMNTWSAGPYQLMKECSKVHIQRTGGRANVNVLIEIRIIYPYSFNISLKVFSYKLMVIYVPLYI